MKRETTRTARRRLIAAVVGTAAASAVAAGLLAPAARAGQARAGEGATGNPAEARADGWPEPAPAAPTPWGEPDLQGLWTTRDDTPLQRPAQFADKEFFTDEERAELDRRRSAILDRDARPEVGNPLSTGGAYNRAVFLTHKRTGRRTSLIVDPPDGRIPALTPEAQARRQAMREYQLALLQATPTCRDALSGCAGGTYGPPSPRRDEPPPFYLTGAINRADGPEDRSLGERCMLGRLPDFGGAAGFVLQIVQSPGAVSVFYDTGQGQGWQRTIPVTDRPHLPPEVRLRRGDSRGRWEGDTLVVDVTNFSPKSDFRGARENLRLVERWTRLDSETLEYVVTIEDPTTWVRPWTVALALGRQDAAANRIYKEPRCHEGNYGLPALLAGARADERAFAEGRGPHPAAICTAGCGAGLDAENRDPLR